MKTNRFLFLLGAIAALAFINLSAAAESKPKTPKLPVTNEYQGVKVEDPYQWLEKDDDPAVKAWSDAENQRTRAYLDKLPDRAAIEKQLTEWFAKTAPTYSGLVSRPGILFAMKFQPPKQQPMLVTLASPDDLKSEKMVLDPNALDVPVPSLILQPIIENALEHGASRAAGEGRIEIDAHRDGGRVVISVRDNGPGVREESAGVGVSNTRARLAQLYGGEASLTLTSAPSGGAIATITIPTHG